MSRADACRTLATLVVAVSLVSCGQSSNDETVAVSHTDAVSPVNIDFKCDSIISIGLVGANGAPAWAFITPKKDTVSWTVPSNVTINSITAKPQADSLPLDSAGTQGHAPGVPFKSKVQDSNKPKTEYHYKIDATCHPASGPDVHLLIDPEMIVR